MVTTFYPPHNFGGDGLFVQQLARDLVTAGHEVEVVHCVDAWRTCGGEDHGDPPPGIDGVVVHRLRSPLRGLSPLLTQQTGRPMLKRGKLEEILARGFDVVNYHNVSLVGGPGLFQLGDDVGAKVWTLHEHWWVCPTHVLWRHTGELCEERDCLRCSLHFRTPPQAWRRSTGWMGRCLEEVDLLMAPSAFTARRHADWMRDAGVDVPLRTVPEYTLPMPPAAGGLPAGLPERFFLYVGRLSRVKGTEPLMDAFARRRDLPLVVVGDGEARSEMEGRHLPNVTFAGRVPREELGAYYAAAAGLVFPSVCAETFGLSACEALSCGTPVVSSRCGGTEDFVDGDVGFLYGNQDEMVAALERLWREPELGKRLGDAGRARHAATYTRELYLARYLEAVAEAAELRRGRTRASS